MSGPLRILAVGNMYPPHHQGGYELVWQATMRYVRHAGCQTRVLVSTHRESFVHDTDEPGVYRTLRWYWDWERHEHTRLPLRERLGIERANAAELRRHLLEFQPDVVTWWSMGHMSLSLIEQVRRAGIPAVFSVHNDWLVYGWTADQWIRMWPRQNRALRTVADRILRIPTHVELADAGPILFNSEYTLRTARRANVAMPHTEVIPPGIKSEFLDPLPSLDWRWRLLYVGRIDKAKGVDTAVQALGHLPTDARLEIFGKGDKRYADELHRQATRAGTVDRVSFGEFRSAEALRRAYGESDVVLFPVRGKEPWGLVPLEAMGVGRPVVSTSEGGTAEFVRDGRNALLIRPNDPVGLAAAVTRLAVDGALRAALIKGGRETAAKHTAAEFERRTYAEILAAARRAPNA